jgi:hypothetical protein
MASGALLIAGSLIGAVALYVFLQAGNGPTPGQEGPVRQDAEPPGESRPRAQELLADAGGMAVSA